MSVSYSTITVQQIGLILKIERDEFGEMQVIEAIAMPMTHYKNRKDELINKSLENNITLTDAARKMTNNSLSGIHFEIKDITEII